MQTVEIKEKLHQYIENSDEKLLKLMFALAKEYNEDDVFEYEFSEKDIQELDELRVKRINGESKTYSWGEAKSIITRKN